MSGDSGERITASQIVDDFFHEFCEGRLDRDEMIEAIVGYARQYADDRDEYNNGEGDGDGISFDIPLKCYNCNHVTYLTSNVAKCDITHKEHDWDYTCKKHRLRD